MQEFLTTLQNKFGFDTSFFMDLFASPQAIDDDVPLKHVIIPYKLPNVGWMSVNVFDPTYLIKGVEYFRPYIRGFIALLIMLFHINHILSFIRQDAGVATGKMEDIDAGSKFSQKKGKK